MTEITASRADGAPDWMKLLELVQQNATSRFETLFSACFKYISVVGMVASTIFYLYTTGNHEELFFMVSCAAVVLNQVFLCFVIYLLLSLADTHHAVCELLTRMQVDLRQNRVVATRLRPARQLSFSFMLCLIINALSVGVLFWLRDAAAGCPSGMVPLWYAACFMTVVGFSYSGYQAIDHVREWWLFQNKCIVREIGDPCPMTHRGRDRRDIRVFTIVGIIWVLLTAGAGIWLAFGGMSALNARADAMQRAKVAADARGAVTPPAIIQQGQKLLAGMTAGKPAPPPSKK